MTKTTKVEEIESKNAVAAVQAADAKVEEIKAKKAADKAKKHQERLEKHPKLGKAINWMDDHKWQVAAGAATGGVSFAAGWFGHKIFDKKKAEQSAAAAIDVTPVEESETAPFDTEA
jgi:hypothetical protein